MSTSLRTDIVALLVNYLENRCSATELEQVKQILSAGGYEAEWSAALAQVATSPESQPGKKITAERKRQLYYRIDDTLNRRTNTPFLKRHNRLWMAAAASVLLFVAGFWLIRQNTKPAALAFSETVAAIGQRKFITLGDGTKIWLNNNSKIRYPEEFSGNSRDVYLDGEAFFDVAHNTAQPFRVHLTTLTVQVLGTSFNINSYQNDPTILVAVATGKVGVTTSGQVGGQLLLPGDRLTYDRQHATFEKGSIAIADVNAWKEDRMVFQESTLGDICHVLERAYGITIHFEKDPLRDKRMTLKVQHESLTNVLEIMKLTTGIHYQQSGKEIWIK